MIDILFCKFGCSGDTDSVVPITGTRYSIRALKLQPLSKWYPWNDDGQVEKNNSILSFLSLISFFCGN